MGEEDAFIRAIQAHPDDTVGKLAYADWLEERGQAARAEYLRRWVAIGSPGPGTEEVGWTWASLLQDGGPRWDLATLVAFARLEGMLETYATLNDHSSDISYSFGASLVRPSGTIADLATRHFGERCVPVSLAQLEDWRGALRTALDRWFFGSLGDLQVGSRRLLFQVDYGRRYLVDAALGRVLDVVRPTCGWRAQITEQQFYAINWDDFVLEADDRVLFLHFSFSD